MKFHFDRKNRRHAAIACFQTGRDNRVMPTDIRPLHPDFDPFGERIDGACARPALRASHRARNVAVALFWSVALLLVAGRVHLAAYAASPAAPIQISAASVR